MRTIGSGVRIGLLALLALTTSCGGEAVLEPVAEQGGLTSATYESYRTRFGPQPSDAAWQRIDWLPSYRQGLEAAAEQQKPILLWVMNGHPLGCT